MTSRVGQQGGQQPSVSQPARGGPGALHPVVDVLHRLPLDHGHLVEAQQAAHRLLLSHGALESEFVREAGGRLQTAGAVGRPGVAGLVTTGAPVLDVGGGHRRRPAGAGPAALVSGAVTARSVGGEVQRQPAVLLALNVRLLVVDLGLSPLLQPVHVAGLGKVADVAVSGGGKTGVRGHVVARGPGVEGSTRRRRGVSLWAAASVPVQTGAVIVVVSSAVVVIDGQRESQAGE